MNTNLRILYIVTKGGWGGAQKYVHDLATRLHKTTQVHVAAGMPGRMVELLKKEGVAVHILPHAGRDISLDDDVRTLIDLITLIRKLKPDVVHVNSSKMGLAAFAARTLGVPRIIFTAHGWPFYEDRSLPARAVVWFFSWLTALLSHTTIVLSKKDLAATAYMPFVRHKTVLIPNGIEEPATLPDPRSALARTIGIPLAADEVLACTIGEHTKNKGHIYLLEAFAKLKKPARLVLIGEGELTKDLKKEGERLNIAERVIFTGFIPGAAKYLSACNVCVLPSLKEGLPYVLIEAGMAGIPIVATDVGGVRELVTTKHGQVLGAIVPPKDSSSLQKAIEQALEGEVATAPEHFKTTFSLLQMVERTRACYTKE